MLGLLLSELPGCWLPPDPSLPRLLCPFLRGLAVLNGEKVSEGTQEQTPEATSSWFALSFSRTSILGDLGRHSLAFSSVPFTPHTSLLQLLGAEPGP